jgi:transcriptional regulator of acetoin/glycerol metabolism
MIVAAGYESVLTRQHLPDDFGAPARGGSRLARALLASPAELLSALERNRFSFVSTAADLGISRHQLYRLLKRHGVRGAARR